MDNFQNYLAIEDLGGPSWHPEKDELVFTYNAPGVYQAYSAEVRKQMALWPKRLTYDENRCTNAQYLSDGTIIFTKDEGGDENFQIGIIKDGKQSWVTDDLKAKFNVNFLSEKYLYYSSNTEDKTQFSVYRQKIPLLENLPEKLYTPEKGLVSVAATSLDEKMVVLVNYFSNTHADILLLDTESNEASNLTKDLAPSIWIPIRFLDDNSLVVLTNYNYDFKRVGILGLDGIFQGLPETEIGVEFVGYYYTKNPTNTYLAINKDGYSQLFKTQITKDSINMEEIPLPGKGVLSSGDQRAYTRSVALNHDESLMAIGFSTSTKPNNLYVIELETGDFWQISHTAAPGLDMDGFCDSSLHSFKSFDELEVPYFRYLPPGEQPSGGWPSILMIHGGPEAQYRPGFSPIVQFYLSSGFAVIAPNIRGSAGYGRIYMDLDNKEKRLDSILDIKHLALHLKETDNSIDGERLIIYGGSYGGFAVLSAMTEHPELWRAGVDIVGISDFVTFLQNTAAWRRKLREAEYGSLDEDLEMLKSISPIHKIDNISAPLFIIQGANDERVPLSESTQMHEKLKEKGLSTELLVFDDEGHGLAKLKNKIVAYPRVVEWLSKII